MGEAKEIGTDLRAAARSLRDGDHNPSMAARCEAAADLIEPIADLLEKHGPEGVRELCEAGEKLPVTKDGVRVGPGDVVWHPRYKECDVQVVAVDSGTYDYYDLDHPVGDCYSTKEAALQSLTTRKGE